MAIRLPALATAGHCGFCEYIAGTRACAFIRRGPLVSSIVNRTQYETGALLIIPNRHLPSVLDLPSDVLGAAALESQLLGRALVEGLGATGLNIFQNNGVDANQHFPHYHVHVVPRYPGSDPTKIYLTDEFVPISISEQIEIAERIAQACSKLQSPPSRLEGHAVAPSTAQEASRAERIDGPLPAIVDFLIEVERLKLVTRRAYVSDCSRRENSAEHSWHLSIGLLALAQELALPVDIHKALVMALIHDICEIDAGDTPAYGPARTDQHLAERACVERLAGYGISFGSTLKELWLDYEGQQSPESRWVKVLDRLMPFVVNLATQGKNWKEQSVSRSQVLRVSQPVRETAPDIYEWLVRRARQCVEDGWLRDE